LGGEGANILRAEAQATPSPPPLLSPSHLALRLQPKYILKVRIYLFILIINKYINYKYSILRHKYDSISSR